MGSSDNESESFYSNDDPPSIASNNTRGNNDDASSTGAQSLLSSLAELPSKAKRRQMKSARTTHRERSNSRQRDADGSVVRSRSRHNSRKDPEYDDESSTVASNTIASESVFTSNIVEEGRSSSHRNNSKSHRSSSSSKRHKKKETICTNCSPFNIFSGVHFKTLIFCILGTTAIMKLTSNPPLINTSHGISSGGTDSDNGGLESTVYGGESMGRDLKSNLRGSSSVSDVLEIDGVVKPTYNNGNDDEEGDSEDKDEDEEEGSGDKEENEDELKEAFDPPEDITESQQEQFNQQQLGSLGTPIEQKPNSLMSSPAANSLLQSDVPPPPSTEESAVGTTVEEGLDSVQEEGITLQEGAPATTYEGGGFTSQLQLPQLATSQQQTDGLVSSDPLLAIQPQLTVGQQAPAVGVDGTTIQSPLLQTQQVQGGAGVSGLRQTQTSLLQPQQQFVLPGSAPVQQQDASSQLQQLQISPTGGLTPSTGGGVDVNAAQQRLDEHASNGFDIESAQAKLKKLQDLQAQLSARQAAQQQQMVLASGVAGSAVPLAPSLSGGDATEPLAQSATITQEEQAPQVTAGSSLGAFDPTLFQAPVAQQQQQVPEASNGGGEFAPLPVQQDLPAIQEQAAASGGGLEQPAVSSEVTAPKAEFDPRPV